MIKLMYARLLLTLLISGLLLSVTKPKKLHYEQIQAACKSYQTPVDLSSYQHIFIMHIGFCASTNYCNEKMVEYIASKKKGSCLVLYDIEDEYYLDLLTAINGIDLQYMDRAYLQKTGIFSVYNIHVKNKRVKYLY